MTRKTNYKNKIVNDPIYGFISFRYRIILDLIDHPWFQRLRRISQLGLSHLVYPGAVHNRFQHAIGAMFLMQSALDNLKIKGQEISAEEEIGALIAILFHDIGHGPFSHALEHSLVKGISHEEITVLIMEEISKEMDGALDMGISIFKDEYSRKFLHELVSGQLDMDRLDYLLRDSFYSGVMEGKVGSERIIKMLNVVDDHLVIEEKGIYSIEKFLVARRLMYWQVYLHKTVISAEFMLDSVINRARYLVEKLHVDLPGSPSLLYFLRNSKTKSDFDNDKEVLSQFLSLDDIDIMSSIKLWKNHSDKVLSLLCEMILNRKLLKIRLENKQFGAQDINEIKEKVKEHFNLNDEEVDYLVLSDKISNIGYDNKVEQIKMLFKNGQIIDIIEASDQVNISALNMKVEKWFLCGPSIKNN